MSFLKDAPCTKTGDVPFLDDVLKPAMRSLSRPATTAPSKPPPFDFSFPQSSLNPRDHIPFALVDDTLRVVAGVLEHGTVGLGFFSGNSVGGLRPPGWPEVDELAVAFDDAKIFRNPRAAARREVGSNHEIALRTEPGFLRVFAVRFLLPVAGKEGKHADLLCTGVGHQAEHQAWRRYVEGLISCGLRSIERAARLAAHGQLVLYESDMRPARFWLRIAPAQKTAARGAQILAVAAGPQID